jgi:ribosome-binding protein aMBF1 (putative translation factor)
MSDLKKYVAERKRRDRMFAEGFDEGYAQFKIGATLRKVREEAGLSQEELANRLKTKKTAISRIENHARTSSSRPLRKLPQRWGSAFR